MFISSQTSGSTTTANTWLIGEVTLTSVTADSSTAATNFVELQLNMAIPASYTVLVTNHAAPAANTRWVTTLPGSGDF